MSVKHISCLLLIGLVSGARAGKEYRDFSDTQGRTIRACIMEYDSENETVKLERENRRIAKVPITIFCETDQAYVRDWEMLHDFERKGSFNIDVKRMKRDNDEQDSRDHNSKKEVTDTYYIIVLQNKGSSELKGLKLEYCIYYEQ